MAGVEPRFSVVIPHRNRPASLRATLQRLQATWGGSIAEYLIVDDASNPGLQPELADWGPRFRVVRRQEVAGPAACRNAGVAEARGEFVLFFDDDSWPAAGSLTNVIEAFDAAPRLAAIGFRVVVGDRCEGGGAFHCFIACGAVVRRSAFLAVGGFPESYRFYVEEYGLCFRLLAAGYNVAVWESPVVAHAKSGMQRDPRTIVGQLIRNNRRLFEVQAVSRPAVRLRLDQILDWYEVLAQRLDAVTEAEAARHEPLALEVELPWSDAVWEEVSGLKRLRPFAAALCEQKRLKRVSLWPVGKDVAAFLEVLASVGIDVIEVLDPEARYAMAEYVGLPVRRAPSPQSQAVVVASFSPGLNWNAIHACSWPGFERVYAGFAFAEEGTTGCAVRWLARFRDNVEDWTCKPNPGLDETVEAKDA